MKLIQNDPITPYSNQINIGHDIKKKAPLPEDPLPNTLTLKQLINRTRNRPAYHLDRSLQ